MPTALLIVDVQNDFCEGGALPVAGGAAVAAGIATFLADHGSDYALVVTSRDHHVDPGDHFASATGARPDFRTTWPDHCVAGTPGARHHPAVAGAVDRWATAEFLKGRSSAAYSAFEGRLRTDPSVSLADHLHAAGVTEVHVAGLAADHCVSATADDALAAGFATTVLADLVAAVDPAAGEAALARLSAGGVTVVASTAACPGPVRPS